MSLAHRSTGVALALIAAASLAACGGTEGGQASPENQVNSTRMPSEGPASSTNSQSVPQVSDPLDVSALRTDPCAALSEHQRQKLNLEPGSKEGGDSGLPACEYEYNNESGNQVSVEVSKKLRGLDDVYSKRNALGRFEPTVISGYPAVYAAPTDSSDEGVCQLYVGVSETDVVRLLAQLYPDTSDYSRPCDVAKLTAETMIKNLKG